MASGPTVKFAYVGGANPTARTATLTGDGILVVDAAHFLAVVLPAYHPDLGPNKQSSQRLAEDVFGPTVPSSPPTSRHGT